MNPLEALTPDQEHGAKFLASRRVALLGDLPGFGKTAQLIRACDYVQAWKILWICPAQLPVKTAREWAKWEWFNRPTTVLENSKVDLPDEGVLIVGIELAQRPEVVKKLRKWKADVLIIDEAHRVKDPSGARKKAFFSKSGIAETVGRVWFATASPAQNNAGEWFIFSKVSGAWKGTQDQFERKFCTFAGYGADRKIVGVQNETELKDMLRPYVLARGKAHDDVRGALDVSDLWLDCTLPTADLDPADVADIEHAVRTGDWSILDRPSVSTVRRLTGAAKAPAYANLVRPEILAGREKWLLFCQHTATIDTLAEHLSEFGTVVIDGRTTKKKKQAGLDAFEFDPNGPRIAICHGRSAGEGLDLLAASFVDVVEPPWNPEDIKQMIARAWRRGQKKNIRARLIFGNGTSDVAVDRTLVRKVREMAKIDMTKNTEIEIAHGFC